MKTVMAGLSYLTLVGLAFGLCVGESMAGSRYWAAVKVRESLLRQACHPHYAAAQRPWRPGDSIRYGLSQFGEVAIVRAAVTGSEAAVLG